MNPWDGRVAIELTPGAPAAFALRLRIPGWCRSYRLSVNGETFYSASNGIDVSPARLIWIPYYSWANRGVSEMRVWVRE